MKTYKHLFEKLVSFENLLLASRNAQKRKRYKTETLFFIDKVEQNILRLQQELMNGSFKPGSYHTFYVHDPKHRKISAAPYRDRVVHHAICNIMAPIWGCSMIHDSYACRRDKGTHRAISRFTEYARGNPYVLKCDIKKYFDSINHDVLKQLLSRKIKDERMMRLLGQIIESNGNGVGLPLGNLTSQWFANLYLNEFDHLIKEMWGCRSYIRYMDDFVVFGENKEQLWQIKRQIESYLATIGLTLHQNKCTVWPTSLGVNFLGFTVFPSHRIPLKKNIHKIKRRLRFFQKCFKQGDMTLCHIKRSIVSWLGHVRWGDTYQLKSHLLSEFKL